MAAKYGAVTVLERHESIKDGDHIHNSSHQQMIPSEQQPLTTETRSHRVQISPRLKWMILTLIGLIVVILGVAYQMRGAPLVAVYKEKICAQIAAELGREASDEFCDSNPGVERRVALILGTTQFLETIPVLLVSSFYGSLADRYGRRPILLLGITGMILNPVWVTLVAGLAPKIPLELVWAGPAFWMIGGGSGVAVAIVMTSAADVVAVENKVNVFSFIHAASLLSLMLGSFLGSLTLVRFGSYPPLVISLGLMFVGVIFCTLLPDTQSSEMRKTHASPISDTSTDPLLPKQAKAMSDVTKTDSFWGSFLCSVHDVRKARGAFPILSAAFLVSFAQPLSVLTFQYMPYRFGISLAKSNLFNILHSGMSCLILLAVLPLASTLLMRRRNTPFNKDLILARACGVVLLIGAIILSLASNLPTAVMGLTIFCTGGGMIALLRSMIIDVFPPEDAAFATTILSASDTIANSLTGPAFSALFAWSLDWSDILKGLPFFATALCCLIAVCALSIVRTPARMLVRADEAIQ